MRYEDEVVGKDAEPQVYKIKDYKRKGKKNPTLKSSLLLLRDIGIAIIVLVIILQFFRPTVVFEHSMEDTLHPEDYVFLSKQAFRFNDVEYGDIVVFESKLLDDRGGQKSLIKRAIGLPGEIIEVKDGSVFRNGERLDEPYVRGGMTPGMMAPVKVPEGSYFVLGDNRLVSMDSRTSEVGFVSIDSIRGKVIFRLFPLSTAGIIR